MKAAVIFVLVLAYFQADVQARAIDTDVSSLEPEEEKCVTELKLNRDEIQRLNSPDIGPEDNADFNKFIGCYYNKMDWLHENGDINYDNFSASLEGVVDGELKNESPAIKTLLKQMTHSAITHCQTHAPPKGKTPGETAIKVQNCVINKLNDILQEQ